MTTAQRDRIISLYHEALKLAPAQREAFLDEECAEDAVLRQSLLSEGEAFIEKPFTPAKLASKAREMLATEDDLE